MVLIEAVFEGFFSVRISIQYFTSTECVVLILLQKVALSYSVQAWSNKCASFKSTCMLEYQMSDIAPTSEFIFVYY